MNPQNMNSNGAEATSQTADVGLLGIFKLSAMFDFFIKFIIAILVIVLFLIISKYISIAIKNKILTKSISDDEYAKKISGLIGDMVFYGLSIFSIFLGFQIIGFEVGFILGGLTFGIGFAFKEILSNMLAGILLLTTREFKLGDIIEIDHFRPHTNYYGKIEEITIRYTVIRTVDLRRVIIPNLTMITYPVRTYNSEDMVRLESRFQIHYDSDLDKVSEILINAVNGMDFVIMRESTKTHILSFKDSGVEMRVMFFVDPNCGKTQPAMISEVNKLVHETLKKAGIVFAYPHTVVTVDKNDKNLLGSLLYIKKN